jgi:hypothetical protein
MNQASELTSQQPNKARMKLTKIASLVAVVANLALGAGSARAAITIVGTSTSYDKVTFSATIQTNNPTTVNGDTYKYTLGKTKINNKALLSIFAGWTTNNLTEWQNAGAQLIYDWDSFQLCVADKTGTNVLFYTEDGITNGTVYASTYLYWFEYSGVYTETWVDNTPGQDTYTEYWVGEFDLNYDDSHSYDYVNFVTFGPNTQKYKDSWNDTFYKWSDSESFKPSGAGSLFGFTAVFSGTIKAKGSGGYAF